MLIIDTHNLCWKAHHTTGGMSRSDGDGTGIILGFLNQLMSIATYWDGYQPIFPGDSPSSLRKKLYAGYKLKDPSKLSDQELESIADTYRQIDLLKKRILPQIGFNNVFEYEGYEADDIMAAIVMSNPKGKKPVIVSNDQDMYQLLDWCNISSSTRTARKIVTKMSFMREYGVTPEDWIKVKQIAGCSSDKVPGVKGVGEKTVIKYLLGRLKPKLKTSQAIRQQRRDGLFDRNRKLVALPFEGCPVPEIIADEFSIEGLLAICEEFEFHRIEQQAPQWQKRFGG